MSLQYISKTHVLNSVRQRTIGSPLRDYVPILRVVDGARYMAGKLLGIREWAVDEKLEKAREYRSMQQVYIHKMIGDLKDRIASGDETPSILGNILRQGLLPDEMVLLASYTGSMSSTCHFLILLVSSNNRLSTSRCWRQPRILAHLAHWLPRQQTRFAAEWL